VYSSRQGAGEGLQGGKTILCQVNEVIILAHKRCRLKKIIPFDQVQVYKRL
jgi:hypothetical protein